MKWARASLDESLALEAAAPAHRSGIHVPPGRVRMPLPVLGRHEQLE